MKGFPYPVVLPAVRGLFSCGVTAGSRGESSFSGGNRRNHKKYDSGGVPAQPVDLPKANRHVFHPAGIDFV